MEKYSSGWRGAPAKGIDGLRRARVQIPPSPLNEKSKNTYWHWEKIMILCQSCVWERQNTTRSGTKSFQRDLKKSKKSSWQVENNMIKYKSCLWDSKIKRSLITEQWNTFLESSFKNHKTNDRKILKNSKRDKLAKLNFDLEQTLETTSI